MEVAISFFLIYRHPVLSLPLILCLLLMADFIMGWNDSENNESYELIASRECLQYLIFICGLNCAKTL